MIRSRARFAILTIGVAALAFACVGAGTHTRPGGAGVATSHPAADEDSIYRVQLPPPLVHLTVANDVFDAVGALRQGADTTLSFVLPAADAVTALLVGDKVAWRFRTADGSTIVPGKTPNSSEYRGEDSRGSGGFWLRRPASGTWGATVTVANSDSIGSYMISISVDGGPPLNAHVETIPRHALPFMSNVARPGEVVFVRAFLTSQGRPHEGVRWSVGATTPETSVVAIPVFDDGRHADGAVSDGVYVGALRTSARKGIYIFRGRGLAADGVEYIAYATLSVRTDSTSRSR